jgi:hypothetical protein
VHPAREAQVKELDRADSGNARPAQAERHSSNARVERVAQRPAVSSVRVARREPAERRASAHLAPQVAVAVPAVEVAAQAAARPARSVAVAERARLASRSARSAQNSS